MPSDKLPFLSSIVARQRQLGRAAYAHKWAIANLAVAALVAADVRTGAMHDALFGPGGGGGASSAAHRTPQPLLTLLECLAVVVLVANGLYCALIHFFPTLGKADIVLSEAQMKLMHIDAISHPGFRLPPKEKANTPKYPNPFSPLRGSFLLPSPSSPSDSVTAGSPLDSSSWIYHPGSGSASPSAADASSHPASPRFNSSINGSIKDERTLDEFLDEYEAWERQNKSTSFNASFDQQHAARENFSATGGGLSFWKSQDGRGGSSQDYSPVLKNLSYTLSTPMPGSPRGADGEDGKAASASSSRGTGGDALPDSLCYRVGIDPFQVVSWLENLRMWISQTVLVRLVAEVDDANRQLSKLGITDALIGEAGLEKVKKLASASTQMVPPQVMQQLQHLVPFLEVTHDQEYFLHRVRSLARGGAMSGFKWNGGGSFRGQPWSDKLPTDAELVMHCLAAYFDSRLPPAKGIVDGRTFTSLYFFRMPDDKVALAKSRAPVSIVQTGHRPAPHYILQIGSGEGGGRKLELAPGRNNLFHTLLLFLHRLKTKENGMLGKVNLGRSGLNVLWVIEEQ